MARHDKGAVEQEIENWVRKHVVFPDKEHGPCDHVVVKHYNVDRKADGDVSSIRVGLDSENELDGLLTKIADAAQRDANDVNQGVQVYAICAYYPQHKGYTPRKVFRVAPDDDEVEHDLAPSEPPNEKGLITQLMRHNEAIMRTSTVATGQLLGQMKEEIRRQSDMNAMFSKQHMDFLILFQDTVDGSHRRRLDERAQEASLAVKEDVLTKLSALIPVIINRVAGKQVLPEENHSLMLMASMLESLDDNQQATILGTLNDGQRIALAEVMATYEKQKSKFFDGQKKIAASMGHKGSGAPPAGDGAVPPAETRPVPTAIPLKDRMNRTTDEVSSDPHIRKIEEDARKFTDNFRDFLRPGPKPTGDKT